MGVGVGVGGSLSGALGMGVSEKRGLEDDGEDGRDGKRGRFEIVE